MKKHQIIFIILNLLSSLIFAQNLNNLKTNDLNMLYYSNAHSYIVPHLARCYTNTWDYYKNFWDYIPSENTIVFIEDFADWSNGGASAVPLNLVYISMSPYMYVFEVAPSNERMSLLMHHELTHIVAMDKAAKKDRFYRKLFGGKIQQKADDPISMWFAYLATPRKFAPRWYHEGIAVFMETWMSGGIGRALGSYDEMVFRSMVHDSTHIYHMVGLEAEGTSIDFQVGANSYLYGTRFFNYLASKYGPEKLIEWVSRTEDSRRYFSHQFKQVYHTPLTDEWTKWIAFEKEFQHENLKKIRQNPVTRIKPITDKTLGSVSQSFYDEKRDKLYTGLKYPGQVAHLATIDIKTGKIEKICDVKGASTYYTCSLVYDEENEKLFFTTDNFYYRDLNVVDIKTKKVERLITDIRTGDLAFNKQDKSIWGIRHFNGISTIIRLESPYKEWKAIHAFPYGTDMYDLDISPDGKILTGAITHISGHQELARFDIEKLQNGDASYTQIFDFDYSSPANFVFSSDGRYLFGTSYYSGVSNVFRYDFEIDDMSILSNCETGFFRPVPVNNDSLIVFNYVGGKGWIPGWIENKPMDKVGAIKYLGQEVVEKFPIVSEWTDGSPAKIQLDSLIVYEGPYKNWKNMHLYSAYPIVEGYKDEISLGYRFEWGNDIGSKQFQLITSYSPFAESLPEKEKLHLKFKYLTSSWEVNASYNHASFYDLFGPFKVSRKGYALGYKYKKNLIYDKPRILSYSVALKAFREMDVLPEYQNVKADYTSMFYASTAFSYDYIKKSLGAVDEEKGVKLGLIPNGIYINSILYPSLIAVVDYGIALPIHHSSIWLRNSFGVSAGDREDSFSNFYFGGFGNNYIDYNNKDEGKDEKRYRAHHSFPGLEINQIGGTKFVKSILEWNLPPIRFRKIGMTACYLRWARTAVFTSGIITNPDSEDFQEKYFDVGVQIDFQFVLLSIFKSKFSIGYAIASDLDWNTSEEFMISLQLL